MNRLQSELHRLYLLPAADAGPAPLIDASGLTRALVLELARPADWARLSAVWHGVQAELQLPAPAIAVSGTDALQLWFSLAEPVSVAQAGDFLASLRGRYLPDIAGARVRLWPSAAEPAQHAPPVPAEQPGTGNWSAYVAPDLAPVFADTPWLDVPPGIEGQADLLSRLQSVKPAAFEAARQQLQPVAGPAASNMAVPRAAQPTTGDVDPRRFLQQVLNDETLPLALRVEAAKALLSAGAPVDCGG